MTQQFVLQGKWGNRHVCVGGRHVMCLTFDIVVSYVCVGGSISLRVLIYYLILIEKTSFESIYTRAIGRSCATHLGVD